MLPAHGPPVSSSLDWLELTGYGRTDSALDPMPLTPTMKIMKYRPREDRENGEARTFGGAAAVVGVMEQTSGPASVRALATLEG